ncbi:MAG: TetR/AcrR family transcriptional regulator [Clostridia bacterium]
MNKVITSKQAILAVCCDYAATHGLEALNMRVVAEKCNVSIGSIYNYFPSKADLTAAVVEDIWSSIFHGKDSCEDIGCFSDYITWFFESVRTSIKAYPNFFTAHSLSFTNANKQTGRRVMEKYFGHMKAGLLNALHRDKGVLPTAFSDSFLQTTFVDYVFTSLITTLMRQETSCSILLELVKRAIY